MTLRLWIALAFFMAFYVPQVLGIREWLRILEEAGGKEANELTWHFDKFHRVIQRHQSLYPHSRRAMRLRVSTAVAIGCMAMVAFLVFYPALTS